MVMFYSHFDQTTCVKKGTWGLHTNIKEVSQSHGAPVHFIFFRCWNFLHRALVTHHIYLSYMIPGWNINCLSVPKVLYCSLLKNQRSWAWCFHMAFLVYWLYLLVKICFQLHLKHLIQTTLGKLRCIVFLAHITYILLYQELTVQCTDARWPVI